MLRVGFQCPTAQYSVLSTQIPATPSPFFFATPRDGPAFFSASIMRLGPVKRPSSRIGLFGLSAGKMA